MPGIDWKNENAKGQAVRFWRSLREKYREEGAAAAIAGRSISDCHYCQGSFARINFQAGFSEAKNNT